MVHSSEQSKRAKQEPYRRQFNHPNVQRPRVNREITAILPPFGWQQISDLGNRQVYKKGVTVNGCRLRVRVLVIIEQKADNNVQVKRVLCGDASGIAHFYIELSEIVTQGAVLELINVQYTKIKNGNAMCIKAYLSKGAVIRLSNENITRIGKVRLSNKVHEYFHDNEVEIRRLAAQMNIQLQELTVKQQKIRNARLKNRIRPIQMARHYIDLHPDFKQIQFSPFCNLACTHNRLDTTHVHFDIDMVEFLNKLQDYRERNRDVWRALLEEIALKTGQPLYNIESEFKQLKLEVRLNSCQKDKLGPQFNNDPETLRDFFENLYDSPIETLQKSVSCRKFFFLWKALRIEIVADQPLKLLKKQLKNVAGKMLKPYFEHGLKKIVREVVQAVVTRHIYVFWPIRSLKNFQ